MTLPDTPQWRNALLLKIGGYGFSDPLLLDVAGAICAKQALTDEQRRHALEFEARLGDEVSRAMTLQASDYQESSAPRSAPLPSLAPSSVDLRHRQ